MSPLWPDKALALAAWSKAVETGLVDDEQIQGRKRPTHRVQRLRHPPLRSRPLTS